MAGVQAYIANMCRDFVLRVLTRYARAQEQTGRLHLNACLDMAGAPPAVWQQQQQPIAEPDLEQNLQTISYVQLLQQADVDQSVKDAVMNLPLRLRRGEARRLFANSRTAQSGCHVIAPFIGANGELDDDITCITCGSKSKRRNMMRFARGKCRGDG